MTWHYLDGRHVARRRRRRAHVIRAASHVDRKKGVAWVPFFYAHLWFFFCNVWCSVRRPEGSPELRYNLCSRKFVVEWKVPNNRYLPGLCVANKAPADTEVTRKLVKRSPRNASQSIEALNNTRADVFLS